MTARAWLAAAIALALLLAACTLMMATAARANARHDLPCYSASMPRMIRCLVREPGIHPDGGAGKAISILDCETSKRARYLGRWQVTAREYRAFSKQGSRWMDDIFHDEDLNRNFGPGNTWSATAAVLAHGDWTWSSCA